MKKRLLAGLLALLLVICSGCARHKEDADTDARFQIACTTYPVYLLANTIAGELDGVEVTLIIDQQVSCLHDYSLTMNDMKAVEQADVIAISGAGLETFLSDVLTGRTVIDCSGGIELLCTHTHDHDQSDDHHHDHDHGDYDPHLWMSPLHYAQMARNLAQGLALLDSAREEAYLTGGENCARTLELFYDELLKSEPCQHLAGQSIVTFHDGFAYFAHAFDLTIAAAIEEEEGAEASAQDLRETIEILRELSLPAVFTEMDGSDKAAFTISRECHVSVHPLSMLMSGKAGETIDVYQETLQTNLVTIWEAYQ
ncbi:MAG: zinc ABC transporter substrate-binding protein [Oscillospiraceae bacterium]|nr:zinc ABC transporter substrate-binding protein [Oscillospiraceae bacterium]